MIRGKSQTLFRVMMRNQYCSFLNLIQSGTALNACHARPRCPRGNAPGLIIMALRALSQELGYFVESEKGRQQLFIKRIIGGWILEKGYCLYLEGIGTDLYPEQGPVWDWVTKKLQECL